MKTPLQLAMEETRLRRARENYARNFRAQFADLTDLFDDLRTANPADRVRS
jgi:hypothetical protein